MRDFQAIAERITSEGPIPVSQAAKLVPAERPGRHGHVAASTLIRWATVGKEGVYLDAVRLSGSTWYTSAAALLRFAAQLSERAVAGKVGALPVLPAGTGMQRRAAKAREELKRLRERTTAGSG